MSEKLNVILFTAPGCAPCVPAKAALSRLLKAGTVSGDIVDATTNQSLAARYDVQSVPTLIINRGAVLDAVYVGSKAVEYLSWLEKELGRE